MTNNTLQQPRILPLVSVPLATEYSWLRLSTLRQWVFQSKPQYNSAGKIIAGNGFDTCLIRIGRRIYVDLDLFDTWIKSHQSKKQNQEHTNE